MSSTENTTQKREWLDIEGEFGVKVRAIRAASIMLGLLSVDEKAPADEIVADAALGISMLSEEVAALFDELLQLHLAERKGKNIKAA